MDKIQARSALKRLKEYGETRPYDTVLASIVRDFDAAKTDDILKEQGDGQRI